MENELNKWIHETLLEKGEKAIHADSGRVSCYVCLPCADKWVEEIEGENL